MLFGCYRRTDAADPDIYVAAISAVLSMYDADLIREVTDPRIGIMTSERYMAFMPNVGELKVYCEAIATRRERLNKLGSLPAADFNRLRLAPPEPMPGDLATVFVPDNHQRYPALVEWSKTANNRKWKFGRSSDNRVGVWIAWDVWDNRQTIAVMLGDVVKQAVNAAKPARAAE